MERPDPKKTGREFSDLSGKVCVLTGGGGVISAALACGLAKAGVKTAILDIDLESAEMAADRVRREFEAPAIGVFGNVLSRNDLASAKMQVNAQLGRIDLLINAAGGNNPAATTQVEYLTTADPDERAKSFFGLDMEGFRKIFDLNFHGTVLSSMVFAEDMIGRGGRILNISSMSSFRPLTRVPAYSAAKAGVENLTRWLAVHFSRADIRVNAMAPGFFLGAQNRDLLIDRSTGSLTTRGQKIISHVPMGRFGLADELVGTALFLLSDLSRYITGIVIPVDGGFSAYAGI